jgi:hypothetical protein
MGLTVHDGVQVIACSLKIITMVHGHLILEGNSQHQWFYKTFGIATHFRPENWNKGFFQTDCR